MTGSGWRLARWGAAAALLLVPLVAMQFTDEVRWGPFDFAVFGAMLLAVGGAFELALRASGDLAYRTGAALALAGGFLLVWINLAVGFIGDEGSPANLAFAGVLLIGAVGSGVVRLQAQGMGYVLAAMAAAQALVTAIWRDAGTVELGAGVAFTALWLTSAWLFHKAAGRPSATQPAH